MSSLSAAASVGRLLWGIVKSRRGGKVIYSRRKVSPNTKAGKEAIARGKKAKHKKAIAQKPSSKKTIKTPPQKKIKAKSARKKTMPDSESHVKTLKSLKIDDVAGFNKAIGKIESLPASSVKKIADGYGLPAKSKKEALYNIKIIFNQKRYERDANNMAKRATPW